MKDAAHSTRPETTLRIQLSWLITLRWGAILSQLFTIGAVRYGFGVDTPLIPLTALITVTIGTNLAASYWLSAGKTVSEVILGSILALDTCLLTGLLSWSGGPINPFSLLYFVHVTLAAVTLRPVWAWFLVALSALSFRLLFLAERSVGEELNLRLPEASLHYTLHLEGMWVSFVIASSFITYFVLQVSAALQRRERELTTARNLATRNEKLASMATLAAGAAHELGTPLATIAVVAKELEHTLSNLRVASEIVEDTRLIRSQVSRCRIILEQLSEGAGQVTGEPIESLPLPVLLKELQNSLGPAHAPRLRMQNTAGTQILHAPYRALMRALANLLLNAFDATDSHSPVSLTVREEDTHIIFCIQDEGSGMSPEVLSHVGEPFFSTKAPGKGMGLGVFLARNLAEQLGGSLVFDSKVGHGTSAILTLPHLPLPSPFSRRKV